MKLSEIKGEQAFDVLAEIIEPIADITADGEFVKIAKTSTKAKVAAHVIKNHKKECIQIMAALNLKKVEEFEFSLLTLPKMLIELFDDDEVMALFQQQSQTETSSGSASESIAVSAT